MEKEFNCSNTEQPLKEWGRQTEIETLQENILAINEVSDHILTLVQAIKESGVRDEDPTSETAWVLAKLRDLKTQYQNDLQDLKQTSRQ